MASKRWNDKLDLVVTAVCCRPGHGAPTGDIRKKKFTEYQLDRCSQSEQGIRSRGHCTHL